jgi:hypothetical protein
MSVLPDCFRQWEASRSYELFRPFRTPFLCTSISYLPACVSHTSLLIRLLSAALTGSVACSSSELRILYTYGRTCRVLAQPQDTEMRKYIHGLSGARTYDPVLSDQDPRLRPRVQQVTTYTSSYSSSHGLIPVADHILLQFPEHFQWKCGAIIARTAVSPRPLYSLIFSDVIQLFLIRSSTT